MEVHKFDAFFRFYSFGLHFCCPNRASLGKEVDIVGIWAGGLKGWNLSKCLTLRQFCTDKPQYKL